MKKDRIITLIFILVVIALIVFIYLKNNQHSDEQVVRCIASHSTLYIATGCSACAYQEKIFGLNFRYLNTIDCAFTPEKCSDIQTPTWIINGKKTVGVQSIEKLKELTGC
jgi:lipopolysaccharide export system protein LptC